jgi:lysophospholipase L1-like esterase
MKMPSSSFPIKVLFCALLTFSSSLYADHHAKTSAPLLSKGDRVAFVGGGLIERARLNGYLEATLSKAAGPKVSGLKFRNLGWSGDTVFNDARSYFGKPKEGRDRMAKIIAEWKPNVVFLNYGAEVVLSIGVPWTDEPSVKKGSAGDWAESVDIFLEGYRNLIKLIRENAGDGLREIVVMAPPPLENLGKPLPHHQGTNQRMAKMRDLLRNFASNNEIRFVDLFTAMGGTHSSEKVATQPLTHDGLHFKDVGYQVLAKHLAVGLGYSKDGLGFSDPLSQRLKDNIVEKNRLFFHRWRPANETYLFLFRKHEQGNNAKEIPQFDPIIEKQEVEIEKIRDQLLNKEAIN